MVIPCHPLYTVYLSWIIVAIYKKAYRNRKHASLYSHIKITKKRFPPTNEKFVIVAEDGDRFEVEIDKKNRMWVAVLQLKYRFSAGMIFKIESLGKKTYAISQIGTSNFPSFAMISQFR